MYLLVYKGKCASTVINGIKFTSVNSTVNIDNEQLHLFADANGKSYYDDLQVVKIEKREIVPEKRNPKELTVEGLKKEYKLDELKVLCAQRGLDNEGSKTELANRIVQFESESNDESEEKE